jgi:hypothetical protein
LLPLPAEAPLLLPEAPDDGGGVEPPDELPADVPLLLLLDDEPPEGSEPLDPPPGAAPDGCVPALLLHAIAPSAIPKTMPSSNCPYRM